jgi:replicative DNA helicase
MERAGAPACLVVVDYLQLWAKCSRELAPFSDPRLRVEALAAELLALSRRLASPVLAVSSLSREGHKRSREGGGPELEHLKESGDLEYGADVALFLSAAKDRPDVRPPLRALELRVKKQRNGPLAKVGLLAHTEHARVDEEDLRH